MIRNNYNNKSDKDTLLPNNRLIVYNLDYETTEEILEEYFSQYGNVVDTEIPTNPKSKESIGFGFVTFSSIEEATKANSESSHEIDGRRVRTSYAKIREKIELEKGKKLYVGKLPWAINEEELKDYFGKFGPVEDSFLATVKYASTVNGYPQHKGFGFVTFVNEEDANKTVLHKNHIIKGESIAIRKAKPQEEGSDKKKDNKSEKKSEKQIVVKRKERKERKEGNDGEKHEKRNEKKHEKKDIQPDKNANDGKKVEKKEIPAKEKKVLTTNQPATDNTNASNNAANSSKSVTRNPNTQSNEPIKTENDSKNLSTSNGTSDNVPSDDNKANSKKNKKLNGTKKQTTVVKPSQNINIAKPTENPWLKKVINNTDSTAVVPNDKDFPSLSTKKKNKNPKGKEKENN